MFPHGVSPITIQNGRHSPALPLSMLSLLCFQQHRVARNPLLVECPGLLSLLRTLSLSTAGSGPSPTCCRACAPRRAPCSRLWQPSAFTTPFGAFSDEFTWPNTEIYAPKAKVVFSAAPQRYNEAPTQRRRLLDGAKVHAGRSTCGRPPKLAQVCQIREFAVVCIF